MSRWVFAYGSLIWNPGFEFIRSTPARLEGYHRRLCVLSHMYRGTEDCRGLVFGLDKGGHCEGLAYEVDDQLWPETYAYLTRRELITHIYHEVTMPLQLRGQDQIVQGLTYVVDPSHEQYGGHFNLDEIVAHVRQGHGTGGSCIDYVRNTHRDLEKLGIHDELLEQVVRRLS